MKVRTILDNIDQGAMALPEFQRGYVWSRPQVRGLVSSMYHGYPVGSLLTWQTETESASARGEGQLQPGTVQLLLDGQQRVTSLYGLIRGKPPEFFQGDHKAFSDLRFHLEEETFEFWQPVKMRDDPLWIDVTELLQRGAGSVIAEIVKQSEGDGSGGVDNWISRVNQIDQIKDRELHIELVTGDDKTVDVVVDIFNRVNSGGTKLSKGDLALAKICAEWPEARAELRARLEKWREAGFDFAPDLLLRVINAIVTGRAPFTALDGRAPSEVKDGLECAERAIDRILNTLASRLGLDHGSVLPAPYPLVVMARYLADRDFAFSDHRERDRLLYWYLQASMWGRYAGSTETVLAQDLQALTNGEGDPVDRLVANIRQQRGDLTVQPGDFQSWSRGARFYSVLYLLTRVHGARDWGSGELLDRHAIGHHTDLEIHHVFPKRVLYDAGYKRPEVNAIANFTFLSLETNRKISDREPAEYIPEYLERHPGAIDSHWMPSDPELRDPLRYPEFLERRRVLLADATNDLLSRLLEGKPEGEPEGPPLPRSAGDGAGLSQDDEDALIEEIREWLAERGLNRGKVGHELADQSGAELAVLDVAWPRGLQTELSEPVALLLNEPAAIVEAAVKYGYRPFQSIEDLRSYAKDLITLGLPLVPESPEEG